MSAATCAFVLHCPACGWTRLYPADGDLLAFKPVCKQCGHAPVQTRRPSSRDQGLQVMQVDRKHTHADAVDSCACSGPLTAPQLSWQAGYRRRP